MGAQVARAHAGGEFGQRRLHVLRPRCRRRQGTQLRIEPASVELVAAGALRRRCGEIGVREHGVEQWLGHASRARPRAARVEGLAGVCATPEVHQHIARSAVEACRRTVSAQNGQVAEATDVQHAQRFARPAEQGAMKRRHQRRALPTGGHIAAAKVGHHGDTGQLGQQRGAVELLRVADAVEFARAVPHRLAVGTDGAHRFTRCVTRRQERLDHLRAKRGQRIGSQRRAVQFVVARCVEREQFLCEWRGERPMYMRQHAQRRRAIGAEVGQHTVHPVERGAGHQTDVERRHAPMLYSE